MSDFKATVLKALSDFGDFAKDWELRNPIPANSTPDQRVKLSRRCREEFSIQNPEAYDVLNNTMCARTH